MLPSPGRYVWQRIFFRTAHWDTGKTGKWELLDEVVLEDVWLFPRHVGARDRWGRRQADWRDVSLVVPSKADLAEATIHTRNGRLTPGSPHPLLSEEGSQWYFWPLPTIESDSLLVARIIVRGDTLYAPIGMWP